MSFMDEVNLRDVPPEGQFLVEIKLPEAGFIVEAKGKGKLDEGVKGYKLQFVILEPAEVEDLVFFQSYYVGTNDDHKADDLATWKGAKNFGAKSLIKLLKAAQVALPSTPDETDDAVRRLAGQRLMVKTKNKESDGYENVNINKYEMIGGLAPQITDPTWK